MSYFWLRFYIKIYVQMLMFIKNENPYSEMWLDVQTRALWRIRINPVEMLIKYGYYFIFI